MNLRDITEGATVYHRIYTHLGAGVVQSIKRTNVLESMFEKGAVRIMVKFAGHNDVWRVRPSEIRKTPNRAKIKAMVKLYADRGDVAIDGGDILILPAKALQ